MTNLTPPSPAETGSTETIEATKVRVMTAIADEMRVVMALLEELAGVLISDARFVEDYVDQLQAFDLISQHVDESARLLERMADGHDLGDMLERVRLNVMQARLRAALG